MVVVGHAEPFYWWAGSQDVVINEGNLVLVAGIVDCSSHTV